MLQRAEDVEKDFEEHSNSDDDATESKDVTSDEVGGEVTSPTTSSVSSSDLSLVSVMSSSSSISVEVYDTVPLNLISSHECFCFMLFHLPNSSRYLLARTG